MLEAYAGYLFNYSPEAIFSGVVTVNLVFILAGQNSFAGRIGKTKKNAKYSK